MTFVVKKRKISKNLRLSYFSATSHNKKYEPIWELKAFFNIEEGSYHQANVPKELLMKNKKYN